MYNIKNSDFFFFSDSLVFVLIFKYFRINKKCILLFVYKFNATKHTKDMVNELLHYLEMKMKVLYFFHAMHFI